MDAENPLLWRHPHYNRAHGWTVHEPQGKIRLLRVKLTHDAVGTTYRAYEKFKRECELGRELRHRERVRGPRKHRPTLADQRQGRQTCRQGHPLKGRNLLRYERRLGWRKCRACYNARLKAWRATRRSAQG